VKQGTYPDGVRLTELPSGVRVVTEAMPAVRSVTVGFWLDCGSRDERDQQAGASHFLEHLLFKGTKRRTALEIAEAIDAVGGDLNAFTSKEYTCFYGRCLDRDLPQAVDVLGDMVTSARNRSGDVESERNVVLEEIRMHLDTPEDLVHTVFSEIHFQGHPLGREVLGSERSIRAMTRDQIHRYYRRHYTARNLVVAAAGNLRHDDVVELVGRSLVGLSPNGARRGPRTPPPRLVDARSVLRPRPTEQAHLVLGGSGIGGRDDRRFAARVLSQAIGGGMASRLFQEVRERRGLVYSVYSCQGMHTDTGTFAVYAGTSPGKATAVLDVVRAELEAVLADGLTEAELERAQGHLAGSTVLALEDTGSRMTRIGKSVVTGTPLLSIDETLAAIEAVTSADVAAVARILVGGPFTLAMVGPFGKDDHRRFERYVEPLAA
jgi:predicted Zn-dependent peptidase